jgi:hypothetical protein
MLPVYVLVSILIFEPNDQFIKFITSVTSLEATPGAYFLIFYDQ